MNSTALDAAQRLCDSHPESEQVICGVRGGQVTHEHFERSFYRVLDNCGIRRTGVHSLRHTFASMLFEQGVDIKTISTLLGHASVKITMDTYQNKKHFQRMLENFIMDSKNNILWDVSDIQVMEGLRSYYKMVEGETIDRIVAHVNQKFGVRVESMIRKALR